MSPLVSYLAKHGPYLCIRQDHRPSQVSATKHDP